MSVKPKLLLLITIFSLNSSTLYAEDYAPYKPSFSVGFATGDHGPSDNNLSYFTKIYLAKEGLYTLGLHLDYNEALLSEDNHEIIFNSHCFGIFADKRGIYAQIKSCENQDRKVGILETNASFNDVIVFEAGLNLMLPLWKGHMGFLANLSYSSFTKNPKCISTSCEFGKSRFGLNAGFFLGL